MIPDKHLKDIISQYWDTEKNDVADYDFRREALLAQLILDMRQASAKIRPRKFWWGPG